MNQTWTSTITRIFMQLNNHSYIMDANNYEIIKVKKLTAKENRKFIIRTILLGTLLFFTSMAMFIFGLRAIYWFWHSDVLNTIASWLN